VGALALVQAGGVLRETGFIRGPESAQTGRERFSVVWILVFCGLAAVVACVVVEGVAEIWRNRDQIRRRAGEGKAAILAAGEACPACEGRQIEDAAECGWCGLVAGRARRASSVGSVGGWIIQRRRIGWAP
jgi:hypothetical protein